MNPIQQILENGVVTKSDEEFYEIYVEGKKGWF